MRARRPPHGAASGALSGTYPAPGLGSPPAAGSGLYDDFVTQGHGLGEGELAWVLSQIGGVATRTSVPVATADELGISEVRTPATANRGGTLNLGAPSNGITAWSAGQKWTAKLRLGATVTDQDAWSGLASSVTAAVRTADATAFIGARYDAAVGANWHGVVKSGAAAEDTVDLGVAGSSSWARLGWRGTSGGVQFFTWEWVPGLGYVETDVGSPLSRVLGATVGPIAIGTVARAASVRVVQVDLWSLCGAWAR